MGRFKFVRARAADLSEAQASEVECLANATADFCPACLYPSQGSLYGYLAGDGVAAWAWGGEQVKELGLHILVVPRFEHNKLALCLALRFFINCNDRTSEFELTVTNPELRIHLRSFGFSADPKDESLFKRTAFRAKELDDLKRLAASLGALADETTLPVKAEQLARFVSDGLT